MRVLAPSRTSSGLALLGLLVTSLIGRSGAAVASPLGSKGDLPEALFGKWTTLEGSGPDSTALRRVGPLTVRFAEQDDQVRVSISGGCNGMGGSGAFKGDTVAFTPLIGTMMACARALMAADAFVAKVFEGPARFKFEDGRVHIQCGERSLTLQQTPVGSAESGKDRQ